LNYSPTLKKAEQYKLHNGLRLLVVQHDGLSKACVSASIKAGHFFDPKNCQGLAHLLEHLLFMGHTEMPFPNAVNEFIEQAGGAINAWTGTEYTNFHFNCLEKSLDSALAVFAGMLSTPLFDTEVIENEIRSIDAEFQFKRKDDLRRLYQIHKETVNPKHPFSQFSVGNADIFNAFTPLELKKCLADFHQKYYVASNITLCVISSQPAAKIVSWIAESFAHIHQGEVPKLALPPLYKREQLGVQINIQPLQNARRLIATFALPGQQEFRTKPLHYISHILGDEGKGSLLSYLKAKGWVLNLIAGSGIDGENFKDFNISFQLTKAGITHQHEIINALFYTIELLKASVSDAWRYNEKARLNTLARQYDDSSKPLEQCCQFAEQLHQLTLQQMQTYSFTDEYNEEVIHQALDYFTPHYLRVKLIAQGLATDKTCRYYDASYSMHAIAPEQLMAWQTPTPIKAIQLPTPNPYIGDNYTIVHPETLYSIPRQLVNTTGMQFWFAQDQEFNAPKGDIYLSFDALALTQNIHQVAAKKIWLGLVNDYLQAKFYRAEIAGLHYRLYGHQGGFTLHTSGFTAQQTHLAQQILDGVANYRPDPISFKQVQETQIHALQNTLLNKPTNRLFSRLSVLIQRNTHAPIELLDAVKQVQFEDVELLIDRTLSYYHIDGLMHGNWSSQQAEQFCTNLQQQHPAAKAPQLSREVAQLPVGKSLYHEVLCEHEDGAIVLYLQAPSNNNLDTIMCMVLEQMLAGPFFNELRTQKQLGYVVGTGFVPLNQHPGIAFYVQSPSSSPENILHEISTFLQSQINEIDFYRNYWPNIQHNLLKQLQEKDLNQSMKSQRLWLSLGMLDMSFNRNTQLAAKVSQLSFDDISDYAKKMNTRQVFGELILSAPGKFNSLQLLPEKNIRHIADFKSSASFFL
jgi:secreted Zn-dependent insulinase-like peptidase